MHQILVFSFSFVTIEFSIHNSFKPRILLKVFDAKFPYKRSNFEPLYPPAKMAAEIVTRFILTQVLDPKVRNQIFVETPCVESLGITDQICVQILRRRTNTKTVKVADATINVTDVK